MKPELKSLFLTGMYYDNVGSYILNFSQEIVYKGELHEGEISVKYGNIEKLEKEWEIDYNDLMIEDLNNKMQNKLDQLLTEELSKQIEERKVTIFKHEKELQRNLIKKISIDRIERYVEKNYWDIYFDLGDLNEYRAKISLENDTSQLYDLEKKMQNSESRFQYIFKKPFASFADTVFEICLSELENIKEARNYILLNKKVYWDVLYQNMHSF